MNQGTGPGVCPACGSPEVTNGEWESDAHERQVWTRTVCEACGSWWHEVYVFHAVEVGRLVAGPWVVRRESGSADWIDSAYEDRYEIASDGGEL